MDNELFIELPLPIEPLPTLKDEAKTQQRGVVVLVDGEWVLEEKENGH